MRRIIQVYFLQKKTEQNKKFYYHTTARTRFRCRHAIFAKSLINPNHPVTFLSWLLRYLMAKSQRPMASSRRKTLPTHPFSVTLAISLFKSRRYDVSLCHIIQPFLTQNVYTSFSMSSRKSFCRPLFPLNFISMPNLCPTTFFLIDYSFHDC